MKRIIQATDAEISLLKARMNDAYAVTRQNLARLLFTNNSALPNYPDSFVNAFDDGTNVPTYGGINRTRGQLGVQGPVHQYWHGHAWDTKFTTSTLGFTRSAMSSLLMKITDVAGGEAPTFGVMNPADLCDAQQQLHRHRAPVRRCRRNYTMDTPIRSSFPNVNVAGVPIFADHFVPVGNAFFANIKYTNIYISEDAAMDFSGFYSLVRLVRSVSKGSWCLDTTLYRQNPRLEPGYTASAAQRTKGHGT